MSGYHSIVMTKKQTKAQKQDDFNTQVLKTLEAIGSKIESMESEKSAKSTKKLESKTSEWVTLAESGKGKRISLAPENKDYENRGIVISRFKKSIFVPAQDFGEFVAEVEVAHKKLQDLGIAQ